LTTSLKNNKQTVLRIGLAREVQINSFQNGVREIKRREMIVGFYFFEYVHSSFIFPKNLSYGSQMWLMQTLFHAVTILCL
jgi:hypothetical protein